MTQLEQLRQTLDTLGIPYTETDEPNEISLWIQAEKAKRPIATAHTLAIDQGVGYIGFYADFHFDANGKFIAHGVWE